MRKNQIQQLTDPRFAMTVGAGGCIDRIDPRITSVATTVATIGAIADANAKHTEILSDFFDPQVAVIDQAIAGNLGIEKIAQDFRMFRSPSCRRLPDR